MSENKYTRSLSKIQGWKFMTDWSKAALGAALTVIVLAVAIVVPLVYVAFYATGYSPFQKIVVVLVSLILAAAAISVMWIVWAGRRGYIRPWSS